MNLFITGTDTDAGKTFVTALLTRSLRKAGFDTVAMKPISCGEPEDSRRLREAADNELSMEEVTPVAYKDPLAPIEAARIEERSFDPSEVLPTFERLHQTHHSLLVEGVGGWLVPLTKDYSTADLAKAMGFPILLVVRNRLGALNHTLLTLESISAHGLTCEGIVLNNHPDDIGDRAAEGNRRLMSELTNVPILFEISPGQTELKLAVA
ncbi:MAG: dethiobiotin synthase [Verrucomicrobiota bacterium]